MNNTKTLLSLKKIKVEIIHIPQTILPFFNQSDIMLCRKEPLCCTAALGPRDQILRSLSLLFSFHIQYCKSVVFCLTQRSRRLLLHQHLAASSWWCNPPPRNGSKCGNKFPDRSDHLVATQSSGAPNPHLSKGSGSTTRNKASLLVSLVFQSHAH